MDRELFYGKIVNVKLKQKNHRTAVVQITDKAYLRHEIGFVFC